MTSVVVNTTTNTVTVTAAPTNVNAVSGEVTVVRYDSPTVSVVAVAQQGPPGSSMTGFTFNQSTPASPWIITHNLGYRPSVSIRDSGGSEAEAEVLHLNNNETRIYFASPQSGQAYLI